MRSIQAREYAVVGGQVQFQSYVTTNAVSISSFFFSFLIPLDSPSARRFLRPLKTPWVRATISRRGFRTFFFLIMARGNTVKNTVPETKRSRRTLVEIKLRTNAENSAVEYYNVISDTALKHV